MVATHDVHALYGFNSLFEMRYVRSYMVDNIEVKGFNSLFEMRRA